jgi:benzoate/toluate 1,2-dioxygenase reductase subunit
MSGYNIALNFEDGVTRFVECKAGEKVLDAAFRARINLPMDCSDGVCGTCKCRAESGSYDLGDDYIEDALSDDEKKSGLVLTCQMVPQGDCVIAVPASSSACKTEQSRFAATVSKSCSNSTWMQRHRYSCRVSTSTLTFPAARSIVRIPFRRRRVIQESVF